MARLVVTLILFLFTAHALGLSGSDIAFFQHVTSNNVWRNLPSDWVATDAANACSWTGVECDRSTLITINLSGYGVEGTLVPQIGTLKTLRFLFLQDSIFTGPIPREIAGATKLFGFNCMNCSLTGEIPIELAQMAELKDLILARNQLTGWLFNITAGQFPRLLTLDLSFNQLSGPLFGECDGLISISRINLYSNLFSGGITDCLTRLDTLEVLNLGRNHLSGTIPASITSLANLQQLYLEENAFSGSIPEDIGSLSKLTILSLRMNAFSGTIPTTIGQLTALRSLDLLQNSFSGQLPDQITQLTNLVMFDIENNEISGTIPEQIGSMVSLQTLNLRSNNLNGNVPQSMGQLSQLTQLFLRGNQLSGCIPSSMTYVPLTEGCDLENPLLKCCGVALPAICTKGSFRCAIATRAPNAPKPAPGTIGAPVNGGAPSTTTDIGGNSGASSLAIGTYLVMASQIILAVLYFF